MFNDTPRLQADTNGINMFLAETMPLYRYNATSDDGSMIVVQSNDGITKTIDKGFVTDWLVKKSERQNGEASIQNQMTQQLRDLKDIGVTDAMINNGSIDSKLIDKLRKGGYPIQKIQADFQRQHLLRSVSPKSNSGLPSMRG